jgi:hypothetical protein
MSGSHHSRMALLHFNISSARDEHSYLVYVRSSGLTRTIRNTKCQFKQSAILEFPCELVLPGQNLLPSLSDSSFGETSSPKHLQSGATNIWAPPAMAERCDRYLHSMSSTT